MKIYLDVCCINRPFDDQNQNRVRLESEAVLLILNRIQFGEWQWISSEVVEDEIEQTPNLKRRERTHQLLAHAQITHMLTEADVERARTLQKNGFNGIDALHLACAESSKADIFLTTDDKLIKRAAQIAQQLQIEVNNPLHWLVQQQENNR